MSLPPEIARFAEGVARKHGTSLGMLLGRSRYASVVRARHEVWTVTKDTFGLSLPETAALFGVDHTSVLHAVQKRAALAGASS